MKISLVNNFTGETEFIETGDDAKPISPGMTVLWYPMAVRNNSPRVALVTNAGEMTIGVLFLSEDFGQTTFGVRHIDDPAVEGLPSTTRTISGAWDYTDDIKRLMALEKSVAEFPKVVAALEEKFAKRLEEVESAVTA